MAFSINYKKNRNKSLIDSFKQNEIMNLKNVQNYIPIYNNFFDINENNFNNFNLNQKYYIHEIKNNLSNNEKLSGKKCNCIIKNNYNENEEKEETIFFKFSPIIDPIKYMIGKYETSDICRLPNFNTKKESDFEKKITNKNNSSYVDGFFTYLTSQLKNFNNFKHGVDFYGSFLAIQNPFLIDIADEIEYLHDSEYFRKNMDTLFTIDKTNILNNVLNNDSRNYKCKLEIIDGSDEIIELSDINEINQYEHIFSDIQTNTQEKDTIANVYENANLISKKSSSTNSTCSSRDSNTDSDSDSETDSDSESQSEKNNIHDNSDEEGSNSDYSDDESSYFSEHGDNVIFSKIKEFPIQIICLEDCENTIDTLLMENNVTDEELESIIVQILMILITYQKCFKLTHNDLHTNNIMYQKTDKKYLYYKYESRYYKIPTFGRLVKIIDFGRAIYQFKGNLICSDSFNKKEDAATQYNFPPYFNKNKPIIEPNYSFDLCRLSCSMIDYFIDDICEINEVSNSSPIKKLIMDWSFDDNGKNILYKSNNKERYPEFKLYKMITRKVHNHIPKNIIKNNLFDKYIISKKKINKKKYKSIMNIDNIPSYV